MTPEIIQQSIIGYGDLTALEILSTGKFWFELLCIALPGVLTALFLKLLIFGYKGKPNARIIAIPSFFIANTIFLWGIAFSSVGLFIYKVAPWLWHVGAFLNDYTTLRLAHTIESLF